MTFPAPVTYNRLLQALPAAERQKINQYLEPVELRAGQVLSRPGEPLGYVYFPEDCLLSMMTVFENGASIESGSVGGEGLIGSELCLSRTPLDREVRVQLRGRALRMEAEHFCRLLSQVSVLEKLVKEYMLVLMQQISQTGACNSSHSATCRLAKLLLTYRDRTGRLQVRLTHENLSEVLGFARPVISEIASQFKEKKMISYTRGNIFILDWRALTTEACECYEMTRRSYANYECLLTNKNSVQTASRNQLLPAVNRVYQPLAAAHAL